MGDVTVALETNTEPHGGSLGGAPAGSAGQVLYRKWRPQSFAEVAGQEVVTRTLRNAIAGGRLAHAYLFCGPRGTGKTTLGRLLAKAANCEASEGGEPCNQCSSCVAFIDGRAMDFVEQDAASHNSVDDIRQLRENVVLTPMAGRRKVYLLDEVHMLSKQAENALLKTLEEPPPHIIFVLATTDPQKVTATIISRCQRFDLKRIPMAAVVGRLAEICRAEGFALEQVSLEEIARASTGSLRDAINALEQVVAYYGPNASVEQVRDALGLGVDARSSDLARAALAGDLADGLRLIAAVRDDGVDMKSFASQVVRYLRGLLLARAGAAEALDLPQEMVVAIYAQSGTVDDAAVAGALRAFGTIEWRDGSTGPLPLELALIGLLEGRTRSDKPKPLAVSRAPAPQFTVPAAEMDTIETTVATTTVEPVSPDRDATEEVTPPPNSELRDTPPQIARGEEDLVGRVRLALKDSDKQLSALLNGSCEVRSVDGHSVRLGFYHTFHLERIESSGYQQRLNDAFTKEVGHPVTVKCEHAPRAKPETPQTRAGGHLVQKAREMGARAVPRGE